MEIETVAVTGGNGKIGGAILRHLADRGYRTANVSRGDRSEDAADEFRRADLLDAGAVYGSLAAAEADAVIHMGTIPAPTEHPGYVSYESSAVSTYHVLEAATELGLDSVVLPSSINVMGAAYQDAPTEVSYLPVDEEHPLTPRDPYALGKRTVETLGAGFGRRPDAPRVASVRYPWVATAEELRERFVDADRTLAGLRGGDADERSTLFSYLHLEDAAAVARAAMETDRGGHEAYWAVAADTSAAVPSADLAAEFYPDAAVRGDLSGTASLVDTGKAREQLGWEPTRSWRDIE